MPFVTVTTTEESACPMCGGPIYAGERAYVDARAPDCAQWCGVMCYERDDQWHGQFDEEEETNG